MQNIFNRIFNTNKVYEIKIVNNTDESVKKEDVEKKSVIELSKKALNIDIPLDFTKSLDEIKKDGDIKFFDGESDDEIKIKLSQFNEVYRNPVFKKYCEHLINQYAVKAIYESSTEISMLASRMTIFGIHEVLSAFKRASELYEQNIFKIEDISDDERYEVM